MLNDQRLNASQVFALKNEVWPGWEASRPELVVPGIRDARPDRELLLRHAKRDAPPKLPGLCKGERTVALLYFPYPVNSGQRLPHVWPAGGFEVLVNGSEHDVAALHERRTEIFRARDGFPEVSLHFANPLCS